MMKSIGGAGGRLLTEFAARDPAVFTIDEAVRFLRLPRKNVAKLLSGLAAGGWLTRIHRGTYEVSPIWSSPAQPYQPDRYAWLSAWAPDPYYVGFRSALELHDLLLQPVVGQIWVAVPASRKQPHASPDRVRWVVLRRDRFTWGIQNHWIDSRKLRVSDLERTVLDVCHLPRHAGGITEVAHALRRSGSRLDYRKLLAHAKRFEMVSVTRRLGALIRVLELPAPSGFLDGLRALLPARTGAAVLLDPTSPGKGVTDPEWYVKLNVSLSDLQQGART